MMTDLLSLHKYFLSQHIKEGDTVADFTMGNGNDTLWLSHRAGQKGRVYAFTQNRQLLVKQRLYLLEEQFGDRFLKINQSCIVVVFCQGTCHVIKSQTHLPWRVNLARCSQMVCLVSAVAGTHADVFRRLDDMGCPFII